MSTPELLSLIRLLYAMEKTMLASNVAIPTHICEDVTWSQAIIEREILKRCKP